MSKSRLLPKFGDGGQSFPNYGPDIRDYHANTNYGYDGNYDEDAYMKLWKEKFASEHPFRGSGIVDGTGWGRTNWEHVRPLYERDRAIVQQRAQTARQLQQAVRENAILRQRNKELAELNLQNLANAQLQAQEAAYEAYNKGYKANEALMDNMTTGLFSDTIPVKNNGSLTNVRIINRAVPFTESSRNVDQVVDVYRDGTRDTSYVSSYYPDLDRAKKVYDSNYKYVTSHPGNYRSRGTNALSNAQTRLYFSE